MSGRSEVTFEMMQRCEANADPDATLEGTMADEIVTLRAQLSEAATGLLSWRARALAAEAKLSKGMAR